MRKYSIKTMGRDFDEFKPNELLKTERLKLAEQLNLGIGISSAVRTQRSHKRSTRRKI